MKIGEIWIAKDKNYDYTDHMVFIYELEYDSGYHWVMYKFFCDPNGVTDELGCDLMERGDFVEKYEKWYDEDDLDRLNY